MNVSLPSIVNSKKFVAAVATSTLSYFAMKDGMTVEQMALIVAPMSAYVIGQGIADAGKEKARVEKGATK